MDVVRARAGPVSGAVSSAPRRGSGVRSATLFASLFDDAAIFPPGDVPIEQAVRDHVGHRSSWYAEFVGPFVCSVERLHSLETVLLDRGGDVLDVALTVPGGPSTLAQAGQAASAHAHVRVATVEVALHTFPLVEVASLLRACGLSAMAYVEVPVTGVVDGLVADLVGAGLRLKLRTGGVAAGAFPDDRALAQAIRSAVRAGLAFKCTAGLHNAVRHRDPTTGFEHHGFLNVALAVQAALDGARVDAVRAALADTDAGDIAARIGDLTEAEAQRLRRSFTSFGTCSVLEPLTDLEALGLAGAR